MALPFLDFFKKKADRNYYLAFLLRGYELKAVVFEEINQRISVVGEGLEKLPHPVEKIPFETLLDLSDKTISMAENSLPDNVETHNTIFGVKENWVNEGHIKKEHLSVLKKLSDELELTPIGFLVFSEAIAHLLQQEEGAPISAILVDSSENFATITLIRAGRIIQTKEVEIEENLPVTVEKTLLGFENEVLPSRIILFDRREKNITQKFINHSWSKSLPFLHMPQVTALPSNFDTRAVLFGTATQLGFNALEIVSETEEEVKKTFHDEVDLSKDYQEEPEEKLEEELQTKDEEPPLDLSLMNEEESVSEEKSLTHEELTPEEDSSDYFGFAKDKDVAKSEPKELKQSMQNFEEIVNEIPEVVKEEETDYGNAPGNGPLNAALILEGMKKTFSKLSKVIPKKATLPGTPNFGNKRFILPLLIALILIAAVIWYFVGVSADVNVFVNPKIISQNQDVTFSSKLSTDLNSAVLGGQNVSVDENGQVTESVNGSKEVGDSAKGTITILSTVTNSVTLPKGTTITSDNNLEYTFDSDVNIASSSGNAGDFTTVSGIKVTASDIGSNYNLPSGTNFTISNYSKGDMIGKNDSAFSGGDKHQVTIFAQSDATKIISDLTKQLESKAKNDLTSKINSNQKLLPVFTSELIDKKSFDKNIGDQTKNVTLTATISYQTIAYSSSDVDSFANSYLKNKLPQDMSLSSSKTTYSINNTKVKDDTSVDATLSMKAALLPIIDIQSYENKLSGSSFTNAQNILSGISNFSNAKIILSPNLFFLPHILPHSSNHIHINISANE